MKKLIVVTVLSFALVFSAAMIASAAPTVSGEVDFGKDFQNNPAPFNIGYAKLNADANITDNISAHVGFKADPIFDAQTVNPAKVYTDEAWFKMTGDLGTLKVGRFAYNQKSGIDILNPAIDDINTDLTASYSVQVADGLTINAAAANDDVHQGLQYSAGVAYANDMFGGDVNYTKPVVGNDNSAISANAWYKLSDFKLFGNYEKNDTNSLAQRATTDSVIGVSYDSAQMPIYGRVEYDLQSNTTNDASGNSVNPYGVRLGYKVNNNFKVQYQLAKNQSMNSKDDQYLKAIVTF